MQTLALAGYPAMGCLDEPPRNPLIEFFLKLWRILNQKGQP